MLIGPWEQIITFLSKCNVKLSILDAQIISSQDSGYQINRLKTPNITGRTYFNYVQIGSSDDVANGSIPNKYMDEINNTCRKGVTIWHNHANVGNFALNNTIVT